MAEEEKKVKSIDPASIEMIEKAASDGCNISFDRADTMKPCPIGSVGSCCKNCSMGPCRVPLARGGRACGRARLRRCAINLLRLPLYTVMRIPL